MSRDCKASAQSGANRPCGRCARRDCDAAGKGDYFRCVRGVLKAPASRSGARATCLAPEKRCGSRPSASRTFRVNPNLILRCMAQAFDRESVASGGGASPALAPLHPQHWQCPPTTGRYEGGCNRAYTSSDLRAVRCMTCGEMGHLLCKATPKVGRGPGRAG